MAHWPTALGWYHIETHIRQFTGNDGEVPTNQCHTHLFNTVHDHLPVLFIFVLQILDNPAGDLGRAHLVSDLDCGVHQLHIMTK